MAIIHKNGLITGKLGNKIYSIVNGKQRVKGISIKPVKNPKTPAQQACRQKFLIVSRFASKIKELIRIGYQGNETRTAISEFMSHLHRDAVIGEYPSLSINYPYVKIARGKLREPYLIVAEMGAGNLILSWKSTIDTKNRPDDEMVLLLINDKEEIFINYHLGCRQDERALQQLPENFKSNIHAWAFYSKPGKANESMNNVSGSVYLGRF